MHQGQGSPPSLLVSRHLIWSLHPQNKSWLHTDTDGTLDTGLSLCILKSQALSFCVKAFQASVPRQKSLNWYRISSHIRLSRRSANLGWSPKPLRRQQEGFLKRSWLEERGKAVATFPCQPAAVPQSTAHFQGFYLTLWPYSFKVHLAPLWWQCMSFCPQYLSLVLEIPQPCGQAMQLPDWTLSCM